MNIQFAKRCIAASAGQDRVWSEVRGDMAIFVVADGAGGRAGGAEAADIVVREAQKLRRKLIDYSDPDFWMNWLREIDFLIRDDPEAGETTAVVAAISQGVVSGASVGDSSTWLTGSEGWTDLTDSQMRKPFLGHGAACPVPFSAKIGDRKLLLASDGLTKYASPENLLKISLQDDLENIADSLLETVHYKSGNFPDDVSLMIAQYSS